MEKQRHFPSLDEFSKIALPGCVIPVYRDILADTETPVSAFLKMDTGRDAFLLESVEGGEKWGRYSFIGTSHRAIIKSKDRKVHILQGSESTVHEGDPFDVVKGFMYRYRGVDIKGMPRFYGGAIGYIGYDMVRHIERLPEVSARDTDLYEMYLILTDTVLIFDNMEHRIKVVANAYVDEGADVEEVYRSATERIDSAVEHLRRGTIPPASIAPCPGETKTVDIRSNFEREDFLDAVRRTKRYIVEGDIIQAVISQRFETPLNNVDPFNIYRALRILNPSPYMFFLRLGEVALVGSSPEILVRVEDGNITLRPIAGTRPRGRDEREDRALERELLQDPKERAEHIMLVDLGRNDVGRVARKGTVEVDELMIVERYSHVMHLVSNVKGVLRDDADIFDCLRACFPAGTLTGAPKVRAMEIIEELEPCRRGIYGGSVGYFGFSGNMDMCIAIRTMVIKDGRIYIQAGAGIVADSDPQREYEETENKAKAMVSAVQMAMDGFRD